MGQELYLPQGILVAQQWLEEVQLQRRMQLKFIFILAFLGLILLFNCAESCGPKITAGQTMQISTGGRKKREAEAHTGAVPEPARVWNFLVESTEDKSR